MTLQSYRELLRTKASYPEVGAMLEAIVVYCELLQLVANYLKLPQAVPRQRNLL